MADFINTVKNVAKGKAVLAGAGAGSAAASTVTSGIISSGFAAGAGGFMAATVVFPVAGAYLAYKGVEAICDALEN